MRPLLNRDIGRFVAIWPLGTIARVEAASTELIRWLQEAVPWLLPVAEVLTFLGDADFYVVVFPFLYWAVSPRFGLRLGAVLLISAGINATLKLAFATPRPFWVSDAVEAHITETRFRRPLRACTERRCGLGCARLRATSPSSRARVPSRRVRRC